MAFYNQFVAARGGRRDLDAFARKKTRRLPGFCHLVASASASASIPEVAPVKIGLDIMFVVSFDIT